MDETKQRDEALERAINLAGGPAELARFINQRTPDKPITTQAISQWTQAPAARVVVIEEACGGRVGREELRPDIFGPSEAKVA